MNILDKLKAGLLFSRVADRLREASMKGGLKIAVFGTVTAVAAGVVAKITETCPTLIPNLWPILTAGAMAGLGLWLKSPKDAPKP